ncbi:MAG: haloacid dehalogenase-like hydrolase [Opitutia bacterium]|nr:haloacid dehalogenase-like hydrolase [Opitutaceae bacterium]PHX71367.1 MAG: haloacid dehalogenase-like hydrolase [Opitutae bacterium]
MATTLFTQNTIACIWDFDKTLIPEYMQSPLFRRYGIDEANFWAETNGLIEQYRRRGYHLAGELGYLNHLLTYTLAGPLAGLNNKILFDCGADIKFYPGLPEFFDRAKAFVQEKPEYLKHEISLEHYVVSTGIAQMVRGSAIAKHIDGVWACEFIENPLQPGFLKQNEMAFEAASEISQIGMVIDNTGKTRAIFEINKGTNKNSAIDVNSKMQSEDRRVPLQNMIYIADGPSDVPSFAVVKGGGGRAYAVYNPEKPEEFAQNDRLLQTGRIHGYGPADYRETSSTTQWLRMHLHQICDRIVNDREAAVAMKATRPPRHLTSTPEEQAAKHAAKGPKQSSFLE